MAEHPTTEEVRRNWAFTRAGDCIHRISGDCIHRTEQHYAEFDRWLAAHDAEVLEAAAAALPSQINAARDPSQEARRWLRERAATIRKEAGR